MSTRVLQCRERYSAGVGSRHRDLAQAVGHRALGDAEHPPTAIPRQPEHRVGGEQFACAIADQFVGDLRSVHSDLQHRQPAGHRGGVDVRVRQPLGEVGAALRHDSEIGQAGRNLRTVARGAELAGQRHHPRRNRCCGHRVERVQQCGGGDVGGGRISDAGREPRLRLPRHRRLGDHQYDDGDHEITRQKSSAAMKLPRTEPLTFDLPPVRGPYATSRSTTRQPACAARTSSSSG